MNATAATIGACFPLIPGTKLPTIKTWQNVVPGQHNAVGSYGIALPANILVLDADPRNYPDGRDVLKEIIDANPGILPTRVVKTPSGGYHVYTSKPIDRPVKKHQTAYPGVDFLSKGHYVVGAGVTIFAGTYQLLIDEKIAQLPQAFLDSLEVPAEANTDGADETLAHQATFENECQIFEPASRGSRGITLYRLACRGRDLGLPLDVTYEVLRDHFNPRCLPPETDEIVYQQAQHAYKYARNAAGSSTPEAKFNPEMAVVVNRQPGEKVVTMDEKRQQMVENYILPDGVETDKHGNTLKSYTNTLKILSLEPWKGQFVYNDFTKRVEFKTLPYWRAHDLKTNVGIGNGDRAILRSYISTRHRFTPNKDWIDDALDTISNLNRIHPVKDYLNSLVWDGVPRLDTILRDTAGAQDNPYTRTVGKCTLIGAVRRIFEPGCKFDNVLLLEGRQGTGKSTWISILGGQFASTNDLVRGDKDSFIKMRGKWIMELPEMHGTFSKQELNWLKSILSIGTDNYRKVFGRDNEDFARECIFIGSLNPLGSNNYLKDDENRRYWPVKTGKFDLDRLRRDRDQYFAEAVHRYKLGEDSYITDKSILDLAVAEQAKRREIDPFIEEVSAVMALYPDGISLRDLRIALGFSADISQYTANRLRTALHALGYKSQSVTGGGAVWRKLQWSDLV